MNVDELASLQPIGPVGPSQRGTPVNKPSVGPSFGEVMQQLVPERQAPSARPTPESLAGPASVADPAPLAGPQTNNTPPTLAGPPLATGHPDLKLSAHAQQRLAQRNIKLDQRDWERISAGVDKAAAKGSKEALVMTDKAALVVSIKNRTVITAVDRASLKDNVFTNIDSAVMV